MPHPKAPIMIMDAILDFLGYATARVLLPLVTFGKVRVEKIDGASRSFNWFGYRREKDGTILFETTTAALVGYIFWLLVLAVSLSVVRQF